MKVSMQSRDSHCALPGVQPRRTCASICRSMRSMSSRSLRAPGKSFLFPRTSSGMPASALSLPSCGFSRLCSSLRASSMVPWSAASTTKLGGAQTGVGGGQSGVGGVRTAAPPKASAPRARTQWRSRLCSIVPTCCGSASGRPSPTTAEHTVSSARLARARRLAPGRRGPPTHLDGDVALGHFAHVEAHGGNHVFTEGARLQPTNKRPTRAVRAAASQGRVFGADKETSRRAQPRRSPAAHAGSQHPFTPRTAITFTSDVLPAALRPISDSSISSLKNRLSKRGRRGVRPAETGPQCWFVGHATPSARRRLPAGGGCLTSHGGSPAQPVQHVLPHSGCHGYRGVSGDPVTTHCVPPGSLTAGRSAAVALARQAAISWWGLTRCWEGAPSVACRRDPSECCLSITPA